MNVSPFRTLTEEVTAAKAAGDANRWIAAFINYLMTLGVVCKGAFVILLRKEITDKYMFALGRERSGAYQGLFNLFGGKIDPGENCIEAGMRELREEGKVMYASTLEFLNAISNDEGMIRFIVKGKTIVFICKSNESGSTIRGRIRSAVGSNLPWCEQEMDEFGYFDADCSAETRLQGANVSDFARSIIAKYANNEDRIDSGRTCIY